MSSESVKLAETEANSFPPHPEWAKENSMTVPADRVLEDNWHPNQGAPSLSEEEVKAAMETLYDTSYTDKFPRVDRTYADPPPPMQPYGLISFVPAKGAKPDTNGMYGMFKLRGNYQTLVEARERAEFIIRKCDSYHKIYTCYVGRPLPATINPEYTAETDEIDIRKETTRVLSENIREQKEKEQATIKEIKEREEALLAESRDETHDTNDEYITLRVKKAQLTWTYLEHQKKLEEIKPIILKTRQRIEELEKDFPEYAKTYKDKYMKAREDAGIKESKEDSEKNFLKFLVESGEDELGF